MTYLIKHINKLNTLYRSFQKNYDVMKKMFKNHSTILQKIKLSEEILYQAYSLIAEKTEETQVKREFNKIIKTIKK
jgi:hypothetical protein